MSIITAAPWTEALGTRDGSAREPVYERIPVPTHLPLIYTYAEKGDTEMNLVVGDTAQAVYGNSIFDVRSKFATHQTLLANEVNSAANAIMVKRIIPDDAAPPANVRISVEYVKADIDNKARLDDGHYKLDASGETTASGATVQGHIVKFVAEYITPDTDGSTKVGKGTPAIGTLVGPNNEESTKLPLLDFEVSSQGSYGNLLGVRIWSDDVNGQIPVNDNLVRKYKAYPYFFSFIQKPDEDTTAKVVYSDNGEASVQMVFRPETFDLNTDTDYHISELLGKWAMPNAVSHLKPVGPFSKLHIYQDNIEKFTKAVAEAEKALIPSVPGMVHDLDVDDEEDFYRFNIFGGFTTQGVPYLSYQLEKASTVTTERVLRFTEKSNIMASGGTDGTMSNELFSKLVAKEVVDFGDKNSKYLDIIRYPISVFYDTGFTMETKVALGKLISIRKDIALVLVPSVAGEREPTASEESSICVALRTIMQAYPESTFFGTPVMRGMIFAHTGRMLNSRYKERAPLVIEAARKFARYMGSGNKMWVNGRAPNISPLNQIEMFGEVSEAYKPAAVRNRDWKTGMIWVDAFDLNKFYWPALRTVYEDDTSILTSALTMFAICELQKVGERIRTQYSGRDDLTNGQLKERIEKDVAEEVRNRFDSRFEIIPTVDFTKADVRRGYSWLLKIAIRGNNMKTVQTLYIEANRFEENDQPTTTLNI